MIERNEEKGGYLGLKNLECDQRYYLRHVRSMEVFD